jgi:hypothetical protein
MQKKPHGPTEPAINPATGLREDELALCVDPNNPGKIEKYVLPDGTVVDPAEQNTSQGIVSIIHPDLIITSSQKEGFRPILASRLGEMLLIAENLFGKRDHAYTFLGIEFTEGLPRIQFEANQGMIMQLPAYAMFEPMNTYAMMAHECIHMLSPCPRRPVKILEEGMAEVFSYIYMRDTMQHELKLKTPGSAYHEAGELVAMLVSIDPYGVKRMREEEPTISLISKSLIWKYYPMLDEGTAARLARTFVKDDCDDPDILAWYENEGRQAKCASD